MASHQVRLTIESGDFETGFSVSLQCFDKHQVLYMHERGYLPAQPNLCQRYEDWRASYLSWGGASRLEPISDEPTNISFIEQVRNRAKALEQAMHQWLESETFRPLRQQLYQELLPHQTTILFLQTSHHLIQRLPWLKWRLFESFPLIQLVLAPDAYRTILLQYPVVPTPKVKLLAVLSGGVEVDTQGDRQVLDALPQTQLTVLERPTRKAITDHLWTEPWDIFFFAGHSSSQTGQGQFKIAQSQWVTSAEMRYSLQTAAQQGLKLAIFNSCDGLAIAQDLVQNHIPFIITMREPVPDEVAQAFLEYFLTAYGDGKSMFQAFKEARERLESVEDQFPCATWLPVLMCNPAVTPPSWVDFLGQSPSDAAAMMPVGPLQRFKALIHRPNALFFVSTMMFLIFVRSFGWLQGLELWSFDQLMQLRPQEIQDSRILVVEIDEAMIQNQMLAQGSISDQQLYDTLQILLRHKPRVIGLDIYRDHQNLDESLQATFQTQTQIIGICKSPDPGYDKEGVPAPKGFPNQRLGFSDILEDRDGVVRRQLLFMERSPTSVCATPWSFSSKLAFQYLAADQISPRFSNHAKDQDKYLILHDRAFYPIRHFWGGYQTTNLGGNQIMLNYRAVPRLGEIAPTVSLDDVINGNISEDLIRNRLVMIGVTANTTADFWETPYSTENHRIPGVFLQAHMASQLISAVEDQRPLIHVWSQWRELLWIMLWGGIGLSMPRRTSVRLGLLSILSFGLGSLSFLGLIHGLWLPLVPSLMALVVMGLYRTTNAEEKS